MIDNKIKSVLLSPMNLLYRLSPKTELKLMFWLKQGYSLNLESPTTFNEKLQWMKLYWESKTREICSDKYSVRKYVEERCPETLVELYWQGYKAEDIPFDELPNRFVIKVTHGSGFNYFCKDKSKLDKALVIKKVNRWLREKYLVCYGEEFYGKVQPSIIIEEYIDSDSDTGLIDYKILCFDGNPKYIWVAFDRYSEQGPQGVVLDTSWNVIDDVYMSYPLRDKNKVPKKPECLDLLLENAKTLSRGLPHVRVDMYVVGNRIIFGEMSFSHGAGFDKIKPYDFDKELGDKFKLPEKNKE